jgi:hypothetical protein
VGFEKLPDLGSERRVLRAITQIHVAGSVSKLARPI